MANPFQQKARQRKIIYLALIVALFTVSLMHRKLVVETQAEDLQLREAARGEVELTGSFVRLSLTGSRGLATTILWSTAIDRMTKHEWNELELLVGSISKLQPYFITPWVFQGWNLAFNVAVECDRPHDKYYYVSRGLQLLAEGERRNQGSAADAVVTAGRPRFPGQPEMRFYMGFYYQLKIGNSDEKNTMRSLLDLSCIDPIQRDPEKFWTINERGDKDVNRDELKRLCQDHPRLVRRLREQLGYDDPIKIVKFLDANKDVPSRFKKGVADQKESALEEPRKQFPILPPATPRRAGIEGPAWPRPTDPQLTPESVDVFVVCRTWYQYAQEPLPPPLKDPGVQSAEEKDIEDQNRDRLEKHVIYRTPKTMATPIFRGYPSRAQVYIAENLENEGWFGVAIQPRGPKDDLDDKNTTGWVVHRWFDLGDDRPNPVEVGIEPKYHAGPAWEQAYRMYKEFGIRNGLYLSPAEVAELNQKARAVRVALKIGERDYAPPLPPELRPKLGESYDAQQKLFGSARDRSMTNFDDVLHQAEGEQDPETVLARKVLHLASRYNRKDQHEALPLYEKAWPLLVDVALRYPRFTQVPNVQEEIYESMLWYLRLSQRQNPELFRSVNLALAQMAIAPLPNYPQPANLDWPKWPYWDRKKPAGRPWLVDPAIKNRHSLRVTRGPLESVVYYDGPEAVALRNFWFAMTSVASQLGQPGAVPPVVLPNYALAGAIRDRQPAPPAGWIYLIDPNTANSVRDRLGLLRPPGTPAPTPVPK
jgi:hypothetical protein